MNVEFVCRQCEQNSQTEFKEASTTVGCANCENEFAIPDGSVEDENVHRCLVCPSDELYVRKAFPQRLGVTIVVIGLALSCIPWAYHNWYGATGILFVTALIDAILYAVTGNVLQCYRCQAIYRGLTKLEHHEPFNLETHEKYRQQLGRLREAES